MRIIGVLGISAVIAACGGGGGSSDEAPSVPDNAVAEPLEETPTTGSIPNSDAAADDEPQASDTDRICTSHTTGTAVTIGNSLLAFDADPGQCFGVKRATGDGKRRLPTSLIGGAALASGGVFVTEPEGRLTINPFDGVLGQGVQFQFAVDVTNEGTEIACVEDPIVVRSFATILDAEGEVLGEVRMNVLGDQYQAPTSGAPRPFTGCIPAGETRTAVGFGLDTDADPDPAVVARYDRVELLLDTILLPEESERAADLSPVELSWMAEALSGGGEFVAGSFPYTTTASVLNTSMQNVRVPGGAAFVTYVDEDRFVTSTDVLWVGEFLGKDEDDDLTPEELTIAPAGGMLGFASRDTSIVDVDGRADGYRGPASRALVHVRRCFDEGCDG